MIHDVRRQIARAVQSIRLAFRGKLTHTNSTPAIQLTQVAGLADELLQNVEMMQHYGFTSNPPPGTECVVVPLGGRSGHGIIVSTEHGTYRLKQLQPGEMAIYTDEGDNITLKRGHLIEVTTQTFRINASVAIEMNSPTITGNASNTVQLNTPTVNASAAIVAQGDITDSAATAPKTMAGMRIVFNGHKHPETGALTNTPNASM